MCTVCVCVQAYIGCVVVIMHNLFMHVIARRTFVSSFFLSFFLSLQSKNMIKSLSQLIYDVAAGTPSNQRVINASK